LALRRLPASQVPQLTGVETQRSAKYWLILVAVQEGCPIDHEGNEAEQANGLNDSDTHVSPLSILRAHLVDVCSVQAEGLLRSFGEDE
jgi:hypothetical protein